MLDFILFYFLKNFYNLFISRGGGAEGEGEGEGERESQAGSALSARTPTTGLNSDWEIMT